MKRLLVTAVVLALMAASASCTKDDSADPPPPTTTSPDTTTKEPTDEEQVEKLANEWFAAARDITSQKQPVATAGTYLAGDYLEAFQQGISEREAEGTVVVQDDSRSVAQVESVAVSGNSALVEECLTDGDALVRESTGEILDDSVTARRYKTEATRTPDGWRFTARTRVGEWKGQVRCEP